MKDLARPMQSLLLHLLKRSTPDLWKGSPRAPWLAIKEGNNSRRQRGAQAARLGVPQGALVDAPMDAPMAVQLDVADGAT